MKKVVIVGAGFGGLSAAALLAKEGHTVTVLEKNEMAGGRASVHRDAGFTFDMGPSWYLMPDVFERYFSLFGKRPEDFYALPRLDPAYRIFFEGGKTVEISADPAKNRALFDSLEKDGARKLDGYLASAKEKYDLSVNEMLYREYRSILDLLSGKLILEGRKLHAFENLETFVNRTFESDEARKIVQYSIGFLGSSPRNTPSFYHIMSHIDMTQGVFYPEGGIRRVAEAIRQLAESCGAVFRFNEPATRIRVEGNRATGVETPQGFHPADLVLVNADYPFAEMHLLDAKHRTYDEGYWEERVLAPSAFVAYVGTDRTFPKLAHHTLFLEKDWADSFDQVFQPEKAAWPDHPSYYVNVPSRTDPTAAPAGCDSLFILVPLSPFLREEPGQREKFFNRIMDHLEGKAGAPIRKHIVTKRIFALEDFRDRYNAFHGTALGLSHTLFQTALWRPAHKSKKVGNLYYTGQYTHPGIGIPMTLISSTIVAREITGTGR